MGRVGGRSGDRNDEMSKQDFRFQVNRAASWT